ncbi:helix-turn-helix transcriptional regulator [Frankia sp. Cr1]|uniref:helix-turn-helix domain-containing protein n=1 Tax=Frankia sp. Cr1 TaxID=3073931 RepID=UPI002AD43854|nr:helix-turn-helix transcriptional regulator [Frankia sp. Cr1]
MKELRHFTHPASGILRARGIPQYRVARLLNYSVSYVSNVLNGRIQPSAAFRADLACLLALRAQDLFLTPEEEWAARMVWLLKEAPPTARGLATRIAALLDLVAVPAEEVADDAKQPAA